MSMMDAGRKTDSRSYFGADHSLLFCDLLFYDDGLEDIAHNVHKVLVESKVQR